MNEQVIKVEITNSGPSVAVDDVTQQIIIGAPPIVAVSITTAGPQGPPGAGADIFEQVFTDLSTWIVNHNFNRKPASIQLLNVGGSELLADIIHISNNQFQVSFVQPHSGTARAM